MTSLNPSEFIKSQTFGVLSTHSFSDTGYPFGSVTPYIVTEQGDIVIYISDLAEHTKNVEHNNKVSLTVFDVKTVHHPSSNPRITCIADAKRVTEHQQQLRKAYTDKYPDAQMIMDLPGFHFYQLKLKRARLVAGFGEVKWLTPSQLAL